MSFGFRTIKDSWDVGSDPALRELLDVELLDVSVVAFPAYPRADVAVRSLEGARTLAAARERREERLRQLEQSVRS
jgi:phage head maturation protease